MDVPIPVISPAFPWPKTPVATIVPGVPGTELLAWVAQYFPDVMRIMLTGSPTVTTAEAMEDAVRAEDLEATQLALEAVATLCPAIGRGHRLPKNAGKLAVAKLM